MEMYPVVHESDMHGEIYDRLRNLKIPRPSAGQVRAKVEKYRKDDPTGFRSESSRLGIIKEIVKDFVEEHDNKPRKEKDSSGTAIEAEGRLSKNGHPISYPTGYEYAILVASRIELQVRNARKLWVLPEGKPFTDFDKAVAHMNMLHSYPQERSEEKPAWSTVSLDIPTSTASALRGLITGGTSRQATAGSGVGANIGTINVDGNEIPLDSFIALLQGLNMRDLKIDDPPVRTLSLIPLDDLNEEQTVTWTYVNDCLSWQVFEVCYSLINVVPEWDENKLFSYIFLGRLPLLPVQAEYNILHNKARERAELVDFTLKIPFPMDDGTLLRLYKKLRDPLNDPESRRYNFDPPNISEYELILIDLVFKLPTEDFSWSERLSQYLKENDEQIKKGLLPDLGLYKAKGKKDRSDAARNMARDYRRVTAKLK